MANRFRPVCKFCRYPLTRSSVISNTIVCKNCCSSYPIVTFRAQSMPLFILMVFTLTFAGHLLWTSGLLNQMIDYLHYYH